MKRNRWAALLCAALCAMPLSGCSDALAAARIEAGTHTADAAAEEPSEAFLRSLADFTAKTAAEILPEAGEGENALYSPASLYLALAMTADTAAGETQAQMRALLGAKDADSLRAEAGNWYRSLCYDGEKGTLAAAGSLWLNEAVSFRQEPFDRLADSYGAYAYRADFSSPDYPETVAAWVREETGGLLGEAADFKPGPDSALLLLSTLYFKGMWSEPFPESLTADGEFFLADGSTVTARFMEREAGSGYIDGDGFTAASLPFRGGAEMRFILPDEGVSPAGLVADPETLAAALFPEETVYAQVDFRVPQFDYGVSLDELARPLRALGVTDAFDGALADFSPLSEEPLFLSSVRQDAAISIDEEGCVGAAYTAVSMNTAAAMPPEENFTLDLNRPFLFAVMEGETVLFVGIVENPAES